LKATTPLFPGMTRQLICTLDRRARLRVALSDPREGEVSAIVTGFGDELISLQTLKDL